MNLFQIATLFEIGYLTYMFYFFKTTFEIHHPFEKSVVSISDYLKHPIHTGNYESKICVFGKYAMIILIGYLGFRLIYPIPMIINLTVMSIATILSLMNLNAFLYLIPYIGIELYFFI